MNWERTFPNAAQSVVRARRFAVEALDGLDPDVVDSLAVMVSELVTNSVRHTASEFTLSIDRDDERVRVAVSDRGVERPNLRNPEPTDPSGRGLRIVDALSDNWGVRETTGRSGKTVWFVLALRRPERGAEAGASSSPRILPPRPGVAGGDAPRGAARPSRGAASPRQESRVRGRSLCRH